VQRPDRISQSVHWRAVLAKPHIVSISQTISPKLFLSQTPHNLTFTQFNTPTPHTNNVPRSFSLCSSHWQHCTSLKADSKSQLTCSRSTIPQINGRAHAGAKTLRHEIRIAIRFPIAPRRAATCVPCLDHSVPHPIRSSTPTTADELHFLPLLTNLHYHLQIELDRRTFV
jgi:hypothetical protein